MFNIDALFTERNCSLVSLSGVILVMLAAAFIGLKLIAVETVVFKGMPAETRAMLMQIQKLDTKCNTSLNATSSQIDGMRNLLTGHTKQLETLEVLADTLHLPAESYRAETDLEIAERVVRSLKDKDGNAEIEQK
jgi:hypothetical protein